MNYLVSLSLPHTAAPVEELVSTLADEHEISNTVSTQVMSWFGVIKDGKWAMDVDAVLKEIGLGLLRDHKVKCLRCSLLESAFKPRIPRQDNPIPLDDFLSKWKATVGDTFESRTSLTLLLVWLYHLNY